MSTTTIATGLQGAIGARADQHHGGVVFVEYAGRVQRIDPLTGVTDVIGKAFSELEDIEISADGATYFLSERGGTIYAAPAPGGFTPADAPVLAAGLGAVHQLAATADGTTLYAIEYGGSGKLLRIDVATGAVDSVTGGFAQAVGLTLGDGESSVYVSEQASGGRILRVDLASGVVDTVATGIPSPFFLSWADPARQILLVPQRDPFDTVTAVHLGTGLVFPVTDAPFRPSSILVHDIAGSPLGVVAADGEIATFDVSATLVPPIVVDMPADAAQKASVALNGFEMNGRALRVNEARERPPRSPRDGAPGGGRDRW